MELDSPGIEQSGFVSTVVATSAAYFKFYVSSGTPISDDFEEKEKNNGNK